MTISFNVDKVQKRLVEKRFVFTLRHPGRPVGRQKLYFQHEFAGWVNVIRIHEKRLSTLRNSTKEYYAENSGFASWADWVKAAIELHAVALAKLALYRVDILDLLSEREKRLVGK